MYLAASTSEITEKLVTTNKLFLNTIAIFRFFVRICAEAERILWPKWWWWFYLHSQSQHSNRFSNVVLFGRGTTVYCRRLCFTASTTNFVGHVMIHFTEKFRTSKHIQLTVMVKRTEPHTHTHRHTDRHKIGEAEWERQIEWKWKEEVETVDDLCTHTHHTVVHTQWNVLSLSIYLCLLSNKILLCLSSTTLPHWWL